MSRVTAKAGRACSSGKVCRLPAEGGEKRRAPANRSSCSTTTPRPSGSKSGSGPSASRASGSTSGSGPSASRASGSKSGSGGKSAAHSPNTRTASSKRWLKEHFEDPYVHAAWKDGYRSRAAYKLLEIQEKYKLIRAGSVVLDLGAAPGGWTQVTARILAGQGRLVALDILAMDPVAGAEILRGDFLEESAPTRLKASLGGGVDVVLSDMAPNMSGIRSVDQDRGGVLAEEAMGFAVEVLNPGGAVVLKLFHGPDFHELVKAARRRFATVRVVKPEASRDRSSEQYLVATGFRPAPAGVEASDSDQEEADHVSA